MNIKSLTRAHSPARSRFQVAPKDESTEEKKARLKAYKAAHYQANKEIFKARARDRHEANRGTENARSAERYRTNKDAHAARNKAWKSANRDRVRILDQRYRENNGASVKESSDRYRANNPDALRHRHALWHEKNKDYKNKYASEWRKNNREKCRAQVRRRRARIVGAEGNHTESDLIRIRASQRDRCAYCRARLKGQGHADHIVSLSKGGSNRAANMQWLCADCNIRKNARDPIVFAQSRGLLI